MPDDPEKLVAEALRAQVTSSGAHKLLAVAAEPRGRERGPEREQGPGPGEPAGDRSAADLSAADRLTADLSAARSSAGRSSADGSPVGAPSGGRRGARARPWARNRPPGPTGPAGTAWLLVLAVLLGLAAGTVVAVMTLW
ncbi:hypothetical protein [Saccharothrix lopnurensis]|uniref:Uncharacterized protein n=1 Tax=Saccharothrix lopnurensis TaxID=1670621 RepID=A0ABW1P8S6_9PSEU